MRRNQTQGAAMLVCSSPTKSRKSVSRDIFATRADLVYDIIDTDYWWMAQHGSDYHVFMTLKHVFLTYETRNLVKTAVRMFFLPVVWVGPAMLLHSGSTLSFFLLYIRNCIPCIFTLKSLSYFFTPSLYTCTLLHASIACGDQYLFFSPLTVNNDSS